MTTPNRHPYPGQARSRRSERVVAVATCIGCGCDDDRACPGGCCWIVVDRKLGIGVCTRCHAHLDEFAARVAAARETGGDESPPSKVEE